MSRIFKGLALCGAWSCFDEFNRIEQNVLSVIATYIKTIFDNMKANNYQMVFEGSQVFIDKNVGIFVTMNPYLKDRVKLPDNLQILMRPVAMVAPNFDIIAEIILRSEGFMEAKELGSKIVKMYELCNEQLSKQKHYDFGMRALKTLLVTAGSMRQEYPYAKEETLIIKAIEIVNIPKFLNQDLTLFNGIQNDLFPNRVDSMINASMIQNLIHKEYEQ